MSEMRVKAESVPAPTDQEWVLQKMREFNMSSTDGRAVEPVTVLLRNAEGQLCGGLLGFTIWSWLHVDSLWVEEAYRGQKWGRALLEAAELEAKRRGCTLADVDTFSFQARGFYEKSGYSLYGTLAGIAGRWDRFYLSKKLDRS